jgi:hypothetical protein
MSLQFSPFASETLLFQGAHLSPNLFRSPLSSLPIIGTVHKNALKKGKNK